MNIVRNPKAVAAVATLLLITSAFWLVNTHRMNSSLKAGLENERLASETLLSEKLLLEKDIQKLKEQLSFFKDRNIELDNLVSSTSARLQRQESEYNRIKKENVSLRQIRKQHQELLTLREELEHQLRDLESSYSRLEAENTNLHATVASLEERNRMLSDDLTRAMFGAVDQSQIQALKGRSNKLTVSARRTRKLVANFEVPANLKNLSFRVITSDGRALTSKDGTIVTSIAPSDESLTASTDGSVTGNNLQRVEMSYIPKSKLKPGIYTVEILDEDLHVGSVRVKLR